MNSEDLLIARLLKSRISDIADIVDFRVFGSRATGNAGQDSDMDIFIEVESLTSTVKEGIHDICWEIGYHNSLVISPLIVAREELERSPLRSAPIINNIAAEGLSV